MSGRRSPGPVVVAVATYRRPELLAALLPRLVAEARTVPGAHVLVVDNDPDGSAAQVVASTGSAVRYVHEPRPGLAAARNAALDSAGDSRLLVFVDDDEEPTDGWLTTLVGTWESSDADAVAGPAVKRLPDTADAWVRASGFFDPTQRRAGARVAGAASNNLLLDLDALRARGLRFDDRFALTGGEDTMLTRSLTAAGGTIRWAPDAVVLDPVPEARATREWVLSRERRTGSTWSRVHLALAPSTGARVAQWLRLVALGSALVVRGTVTRVTSRPAGALRRRARGEREVARGAGVLRGVLGQRLEEYGRG